MKFLVCSSDSTHCLFQHMMRGLHEGLVAAGQDSRFLVGRGGAQNQEIHDACLAMVRAGEDWCLIDANAKNRISMPTPGFRSERLSFISDAPFGQWDNIARMAPEHWLTFVDAGHQAFLDDAGLPQRRVFVPHGGPPPLDAPPLAERSIGLLFVGNLVRSPRLADLLANLGAGTDPMVGRVLAEAAERCVEQGEEPYLAFRAACAGHGFAAMAAFPPGVLSQLLQMLSAFVENHARWRLLTHPWRNPVVVVGQVADHFFAGRAPDHLRFLGLHSGDAVVELVRQARVVLNRVAVFPDGAHERVWLAMAAGTVVATDASRLVEADFVMGEHILPAARPEAVESALDDLPRLAAMAEGARAIYAGRHTWRQRAGSIIAALASA